MPHTTAVFIEVGEVLGEHAFTSDELAHACRVSTSWVQERVEAGVLEVAQRNAEWRFDSATLRRARRIAELEASFDADPQLAALTADLIEEVARLRQRVRALEGRP
jgi:chaperone modulatory protein CbpM